MRYIFKKLDGIVTKLEEESGATRRSLEDFNEEMHIRYEEAKHHVDTLEIKAKNMERKLEDFSMCIYTIMQNICTSLLDPQGSQSTNWKSYWQEQIKAFTEFRSSTSKVT